MATILKRYARSSHPREVKQTHTSHRGVAGLFFALMATGTVRRKLTPSAKRQKKSRQRIRKQVKSKRERKRPKWESAVAKVYTGGASASSSSHARRNPHRSGKRVRDAEDVTEEDDHASGGGVAGAQAKKNTRKRGKNDPSTFSFSSAEEERIKEAEEEREVESDVDEEKESRLNARDPMDTQLFIKGLPLDTNEEELTTFLSRQFGKIKRVLLVKSKLTQHLSGTGFVHCGSVGLANAIYDHAQKNAKEIAAANREEWKAKSETLSHHQAKRLAFKGSHQTFQVQDPFLLFRGSKCTVHRPLKRTEAQETLSAGDKKDKKKKRTKVAADDPRHLYLLQEGLILPDSPAAKDLPRAYLMAIEKAYEERKAQLRNVNYFVSTTRLSVRNLPKELSENDFRRLFAEHARTYLKKHPEHTEREKWGKYGPIKNVKVVRDTDGQAKGYGFIEFVNHQVALSCLRNINNNPTVFGRGRRLIVAFAVENIEAIQKLKRIKEWKQQRRMMGDGEK